MSGIVCAARYLRRKSLVVVTYHGVESGEQPVVNLDRLQTDPRIFTRQIETLARHYRVVDLGDAVSEFRATGCWPTRGLAITFDDGYRNNLEVAAPILRSIGVPATFFVTGAFVEGRAAPWWYDVRQRLAARRGRETIVSEVIRLEAEWRPLPAAERARRMTEYFGECPFMEAPYPFMDTDDLRKLMAMGFDVQPHGDGHISYAGESTDVVLADIRAALRFHRTLGGRGAWGIAYPYGHVPRDRATVEGLLAHEGLLAAFTNGTGWNIPHCDPWLLRRWDLHGGYSPAAAVCRVAGLTRR